MTSSLRHGARRLAAFVFPQGFFPMTEEAMLPLQSKTLSPQAVAGPFHAHGMEMGGISPPETGPGGAV